MKNKYQINFSHGSFADKLQGGTDESQTFQYQESEIVIY